MCPVNISVVPVGLESRSRGRRGSRAGAYRKRVTITGDRTVHKRVKVKMEDLTQKIKRNCV